MVYGGLDTARVMRYMYSDENDKFFGVEVIPTDPTSNLKRRQASNFRLIATLATLDVVGNVGDGRVKSSI